MLPCTALYAVDSSTGFFFVFSVSVFVFISAAQPKEVPTTKPRSAFWAERDFLWFYYFFACLPILSVSVDLVKLFQLFEMLSDLDRVLLRFTEEFLGALRERTGKG